MTLSYSAKTILVSFSLLLLANAVKAQSTAEIDESTTGSRQNNIITAVPFLLITPDARAGAMGDAGVAVPGDANSSSINPAKLAFLDKKYGVSLSYSPWLKNLVPDINLAYLSGFYQLDDRSTIGASLRYFDLGNIESTSEIGGSLGTYSPNELAFDATFARKFGENFSLGTAARFIYSNLGSGQFSSAQSKAQTAFAVDVSAYFKKPTVFLGTDAILAAGLNISNIGTKMSAAQTATKSFLPTNMKLGGASTFIIDDYNQFTFALDFNKLLVPTQPLRDTDRNIIAGKDPDRSVPSGIFGSFSDAPGGGSEELKEISIATGAEYLYNQQFALRAGYFYESPEKGDRKYFTLGAGLKYNVFNLDFAYVLADATKSPLANTLRFSLHFNFGESSTTAANK
jgi:hypothetical protein